jgi:hypothetical protein
VYAATATDAWLKWKFVTRRKNELHMNCEKRVTGIRGNHQPHTVWHQRGQRLRGNQASDLGVRQRSLEVYEAVRIGKQTAVVCVSAPKTVEIVVANH